MIEPRYAVLQTLFADRVFRIPRYQRFYSWTERQRKDLFSDIEKLVGRKEDQHHFMATLVCHRTSETRSIGTAQYRIYDIVDGQQRMTTLVLLLKCVELSMPNPSEDRGELAKILVKRDGNLILLQTNNVNEYMFNRFIREGIPPSAEQLETQSDNNLSDGIAECAAFVRSWQAKGRTLAALMGIILHRIGFVVYDTEDGQIVYTIFEVLNSRGLIVDWLDKAKSVLMGLVAELTTEPATSSEIDGLQSIWANIYREIAKEDIGGDEVLRMTATLYYGSGAGKPLSADDSLAAIRSECTTGDKPRVVSQRLLDVSQKLVKLYASVYLGPVTKIFHARLLAVAIMLAKGITESEREKLLHQWERVTFRVFELYNNDARTKVGEYVRTSAEIVRDDPGMRSYNQIMEALREIGSRYPADKAAEQLVNLDCYERSPEMCRYILWLYEEHLGDQAGTGATVDEYDRRIIWRLRASDSIEHIFPQTPGSILAWKGKMRRSGGSDEQIEDHVGRIGNLILLPITLNQEAKNHPFEKKRDTYSKHNIRMVKDVIKESDWTLDQIEAREARIVQWAKTRWADL
jgi:Protein of unknown function DUF262/Protein of unknown function (DUF1524)